MNDWQRQHKHNNVGDDISCRVDVPLGVVRDAFAINALVPECRDRGTDEDLDKDLRDAPCADYDHRRNKDLLHLLDCQDSVVLKEESHLDTGQCCIVEYDGDVKCLRNVNRCTE